MFPLVTAQRTAGYPRYPEKSGKDYKTLPRPRSAYYRHFRDFAGIVGYLGYHDTKTPAQQVLCGIPKGIQKQSCTGYLGYHDTTNHSRATPATVGPQATAQQNTLPVTRQGVVGEVSGATRTSAAGLARPPPRHRSRAPTRSRPCPRRPLAARRPSADCCTREHPSTRTSSRSRVVRPCMP